MDTGNLRGGVEIDDYGAPVAYWMVLMGSKQIMGYRVFGAIRDEQAGFLAVPYFVKSWVQEDPAVRYIIMQSAPLVVPYRVNASFCATVL